MSSVAPTATQSSSPSLFAGNLPIPQREEDVRLNLRRADGVRAGVLAGVLDWMATPFFDGARPNDLTLPNTTMVFIAMAVRIAMDPVRWKNSAWNHGNDMWACRRVSRLFERSFLLSFRFRQRLEPVLGD